jgi:outer membrane protein TolC
LRDTAYIAFLAVAAAWPALSLAQAPRVDLPAVVARVAEGPAREAGDADADALRANSDAARLGLLPTLSVSAQIVRESSNVAPGATWGNEGIPAISGPPFQYRFDGGTWMTQVGAGVSFSPTDLLRRIRLLDGALAEEDQARETRRLARLDRAADAAAAFLAVVAAERARAALESAAERLDAWIRALPEDAAVARALAEAERGALATRLAMARRTEASARAQLAGQLGLDAVAVVVTPPRDGAEAEPATDAHPGIRSADAAVRVADARVEAARLELLPRVELLGALWARGSGLPYPGQTELGDATGLLPERPGWALGLLVTWRVLDLPAAEARMRAAEARARGDRARRDVLRGRLEAQIREARAQHGEALAVRNAAREALAAAQRALAVVEGPEGERASFGDRLAALRFVANASLEAALAEVASEQAALLFARAHGDLEPFVARYRR